MAQSREFYIPANSRKVASKKASAVVYVYESAAGSVPMAIAFYGKAQKPSWHFLFKSEADRAKRIAKFFAESESIEAYKAKKKAEVKEKMAQPHGLKIGDILDCHWGYEQSNVDFYQVIALAGQRSVTIQQIASEKEYNQWAAGRCVPVPGQFIGEPMKKQVSLHNSIKIASYASASMWNGKSVYGQLNGCQTVRIKNRH